MSASEQTIATEPARRTEQQWRAWAAAELRRARRDRYAWTCLMLVMSALAGLGTIAVTIPAIYLHHIAGNVIVVLGLIAAPYNAGFVGSHPYWERRCGLSAQKREQHLWELSDGLISVRHFLSIRSKRFK